jgi:hypothetical protein
VLYLCDRYRLLCTVLLILETRPSSTSHQIGRFAERKGEFMGRIEPIDRTIRGQARACNLDISFVGLFG